MSHKFYSHVGVLKFDEEGAYLDDQNGYVLDIPSTMKQFEGRKVRITIEDEEE